MQLLAYILFIVVLGFVTIFLIVPVVMLLLTALFAPLV